MQYDSSRSKSFIYSFVWIWVVLLATGGILVVLAVVLSLVLLPSVSGYEETGLSLAFLFVGASGVGSFMAGVIMLKRHSRRHEAHLLLKETGERVIAEITNGSNIKSGINHKYSLGDVRLKCACTISGRPHVFTSSLLYMSPMPYLPDGKVTVYYDRRDISRYFVDIDGSVAADGTTIL